MPSRPSVRRAPRGDRIGRARRLRRRVAVAQPGDQRLGRAHRRRAAAQHGGEHALDGLVERRVVGVHLVREPDRERVRAADQLAGEEQRAGLRAADARERERARSSPG